MKKILTLFTAILLTVTFMPAFASAGLTTEYYATNVPTQSMFSEYGGTLGSRFTVNSTPVTVTQLGIFDAATLFTSGYLGDGLVTSHAVGIWDSGGNLLASATVAAGTAATLDQGFRWASLTSPLTLYANTTYIIGAFYGPTIGLEMDWIGGSATINSLFTLNSGRYIQSSVLTLQFPSSNVPNLGFGYFGPNMAVTPVPIPAAIWLLGSGLIGLVGLRRKFKK